MINLIKLELRKNKGLLELPIIGLIATITLFLMINKLNNGNETIEMKDYIFFFSESIRKIFIVYCGVLFSRYFINEYKLGTIKNIKGYPIDKRKVFFAKLVIVFCITMLATFIVEIILGIILVKVNSYQGWINGLTIEIFLSNIPYFIYAMLFGITAVPLAIGIGYGTKSTAFTIFLSIFAASANNPGMPGGGYVIGSMFYDLIALLVIMALIVIPIVSLIYIDFTKNGI